MKITQEGSSISRQNLKENLESLHLALTLFYYLHGFCFKTEFLNPSPLSLIITIMIDINLFSKCSHSSKLKSNTAQIIWKTKPHFKTLEIL